MLLPISAIFWFSLAEISVKLLYLLSLQIDFESIFFSLTFLSLIGLLFYLFILIWISKRVYIFFNSSRTSIIVHSVSGLGGLLVGYYRIVKDLFIETHIVNDSTTDFVRMWMDSPVLTVIFLIVSIFVAVIFFIGFVIVPFGGNEIEITS